LALESGAPIVPVGLSGTRELVPRGSWMFRSTRVGIVVGHPIETQGLTVEDRDQLMERVRKAIENAREGASLMR